MMKNVLIIIALVISTGAASAGELILSPDGGKTYSSFGPIANISFSSKGLKISYGGDEPWSCLISSDLAKKSGTDLVRLGDVIQNSSPNVICEVSSHPDNGQFQADNFILEWPR